MALQPLFIRDWKQLSAYVINFVMRFRGFIRRLFTAQVKTSASSKEEATPFIFL